MAVNMSEVSSEPPSVIPPPTVIPSSPINTPSTVIPSSTFAISSPSDSCPPPSGVLARIGHGTGKEFLCGWGAASINIITTFPMNKVIFRQQLLGVGTRVALVQLQREGLFQLYRGVLPPLLQKSASLSIMFGMYDKFSKMLCVRYSSIHPRINQAGAAMMAGCMEAALMPFERIQTLLQDKSYHGKYRNTLHAFIEIRHSYGFREYFRGLSAILMRNGPSNVLFFQFRNDIKHYLPQSEGQGGEMARNFVSGGILGALISTLFFPLNVVKTHMQRKVGGPFTSFRRTLMILYQERNGSVRALFRGVHVNYTRSLISWGIINASYELLKSLLSSDCDR